MALKLPREPKGLVAKEKHPPQLAAEMAVWAAHDSIQDVVEMTSTTAECLAKVLGKAQPAAAPGGDATGPLKGLDRVFRDIFGNPFRPVTLDPSWLASTVVAIASQMYESRDSSAMPVLADALQDAGCGCPDVLAHCGDPRAAHARGCWVVDLLLNQR